jgi:hypothetical protein
MGGRMAELQGSERRGLFSRALSGGALTAGAFAASQALRLGSNLILTRLLYPEAFGVMALVTMVLVGLQMFSDTGIGPAISRSPRGDEPGFLNTAWTVNVIRGLLLWGLTALAAWPMARFLRGAGTGAASAGGGAGAVIAGFNPTRIDTANRHLLLGRVTLVELAAQVAAPLHGGAGGGDALRSGRWCGAALADRWPSFCCAARGCPGPVNRFAGNPRPPRN